MSKPINHEKASHGFTLTLFVGTTILLCILISPFFGALVAAISLGISFYPVHLKIKKWLHSWSPGFQAAITDFIVVIFIVLPFFLMAWAAIGQSDAWSPFLKDLKENVTQWRNGKIMDSSSSMKELGGWLSQTFSIHPSQFRRQATEYAEQLLNAIAAFGAKAATQLVSSLANIALMIFTLFFVFRDGHKIYSYLESYLPLREEQKNECRERGHKMITGVIRGWLLGAILQGVVASLGYLIAGVKGWIFFGFLTILTGLIPVVGTALVWIPLAISAFLHSEIWQGVFILFWGVLVVGLIDNLLRPYLVGKNSDVPFVYLFFSLLGGLEVWGLKGIILGPVLVAISPVIFDIYKKRYLTASNNKKSFQNKRTESDDHKLKK